MGYPQVMWICPDNTGMGSFLQILLGIIVVFISANLILHPSFP